MFLKKRSERTLVIILSRHPHISRARPPVPFLNPLKIGGSDLVRRSMPLVRITLSPLSNNFLSRKIHHEEFILSMISFLRLCKSRRKRSSSSSFLLIVWPYKEKCGWPAAKWAKRGQGQCSTCRGIDDRQWRKRIRERWLYEEGTGE